MSATCFSSSMNTPASSLIFTLNTNLKPTSSIFDASSSSPSSKRLVSLTCRASSPSSSSSIVDFDLYDLLGVESFSDQSQIRAAYRTLQKRCHPDIAGPAGHDMAIILNEAYSVLSDPISRRAYDKEQSKLAELKGYTGKPIYSAWYGSETEHRAVFVDEVKCVGCLKCALCAEKTFAIESVYGRARVVAQWADPETKIYEAMEACPVDCISVVEKSDLASLEFLMSKQPRGNVRVGAGNTVGTRVSNIFADVKKFRARYADAMSKATGQNSQETDLQREARITAIQAIRSISNWWYWQSHGAKAPKSVSQLNLTHRKRKSANPDIKKLQDAAAARKVARESRSINKTMSNYLYTEEYWIPSTLALPSSEKHSSKSEPLPGRESKNKQTEEYEHYDVRKDKRRDSILWRIPIGVATLAAFIVQFQVKGGTGELKDHIGGSLALSVVNSSWLPVMLAGITWYFIGIAVAELVEATQTKQ